MIPLENNLKDWIEVATWIVAIIAGILGFFKYLIEQRRNREQRKEELAQRRQDLRWRQTEAARNMIDSMLRDESVKVALNMFDTWSCEVEIKPGKTEILRPEQWLEMLNMSSDLVGAETAFFVRNCFDNLFYHMAMLEHYVQSGLIQFEDISYPSSYYIKIMNENRDIYVAYLRRYGLDRAERFLHRFPEWGATIHSA